MDARIRAGDWAASPLGPLAGWPPSLRTLADLMLAARHPMFIAWGPDRTLLYNDGYALMLGRKHPVALGQPFLEVWAEARDALEPLVDRVIGGEPVHMDDIALTLQRYDRPEKAHFAFSYTPVRDEAGTVQGLFCSCTETTAQVAAARLLAAETERRQQMFEQAPGFICVLQGPEHRFEFVNAAYARLFGDRDFAGRPAREVFPDLAGQGFYELLDHVYATGQSFVAHGSPIRVQHTPGTPAAELFIDFIYQPVSDVDGRVTGIFCQGHDVTEAQRTQAALRDLNADLELQVLERARERGRTWQVSPDLLAVINRDGRFAATNPAWQVTLGWSADELARMPWHRFVHPADLERSRAAFSVVMHGDPVLRFENRYRCKFGDYRWLSWVAVPEGGKLYCSARDITNEREQAAELAARTAELDRVWRNSRDLLVVVDVDGIFHAVNPAWTAILGHDPADVVGHSFLDFVWPDDASMTQGALEAAVSKRDLTSFENRYRHQDGTPRWIAWHSAIEGELVYAYGRDVTTQKAAEEELLQTHAALEASQARLLSMFETSYQLIGLLDPDGRMIDVNATALAAIESRREDVVGRLLWETPWFTATPGMPEQIRAAVQAAARGESMRREMTGNVAAGPRTYDFSMRPVRDRHGTVVAIMPEALDITERRQAEEALRQSQKMEAVGQLTGGLAHDFNNLLTGITGSLELLQTRLAQGRLNDLDRYITAAQGASQRAAALTHRLLAFSRRQTLDPKATEVDRLVTGMEELIRRTVGPSIGIEVVGAAGLWTTLVDPNQLENALLNLCINARDAMPGGGRLTIETGNRWLDDRAARARELPPGQYVSLCVSDTGTGMTPEVARRAFDPFYTTKPIGLGTGLGLSMIYGFVRQSGGQARIESEPGQGTTICLLLPRHAGEAEEAEAPRGLAEAPRADQGETVLVVDDEPTVRMLVAEVLEDLGYVAIEAADGAAGLQVLRSNARVDLLITDVGLPGGMNGRQMADAARTMRPHLKTLFITGYAENAVIGNGQLERGMHVLTKPFAMEELAGKIKGIIAGP